MATNQILTLTVFVVVITIVGTIALAAVGYLAFRMRERKNPAGPSMDETMQPPYFFERLTLSPTPLDAENNGADGSPRVPAAEHDPDVVALSPSRPALTRG